MRDAILSIALAGLVAATVSAASSLLIAHVPARRGGAVRTDDETGRGRTGYLLVCYGIIGLAAVSLVVFVLFWVDARVGKVAAVAIVAASVAVLIWRRRGFSLRRGRPLALLILGVALLYTGLLYLWRFDEAGFILFNPRMAGQFPLPSDNYIPQLLSDRLWAGLPTSGLIGDWNGGDRPPLQAGLLLLVRPLSTFWLDPGIAAFGASVCAQLLWVPALYALLRAIGTARRITVASVIMAAVTSTTMVNTLFTWPKMLSAALILVAATFLVDAWRHPNRFAAALPAAGVASVLAMLAHGVAAFTLPLLAVGAVMAYRRQQVRPAVISSVLTLLVAGAAYLPWFLYQRLADPPGDRLLKWHLAGATEIDSRSFGRALIDAYSSVSPSEWISGRIENLARISNPDLLAGIGWLSEANIRERRSAEFFYTSMALGWAAPAIVAILIVLVIGIVRRRSWGREDRIFLGLLATSLLCILFWALVMFVPSSTSIHQGSQVWLLLLLVAPVRWLLVRGHALLGWGLIVAQLALLLAYYAPAFGSNGLAPVALALLVVGVALCALAVRVAGSSGSGRASMPAVLVAGEADIPRGIRHPRDGRFTRGKTP